VNLEELLAQLNRNLEGLTEGQAPRYQVGSISEWVPVAPR